MKDLHLSPGPSGLPAPLEGLGLPQQPLLEAQQVRAVIRPVRAALPSYSANPMPAGKGCSRVARLHKSVSWGRFRETTADFAIGIDMGIVVLGIVLGDDRIQLLDKLLWFYAGCLTHTD